MAGRGRSLLLTGVLRAGACSTPSPPACPAPAAEEHFVFVRSHGWHVDIGLLASDVEGGLAVFRDIFPGATSLMLGYGKKTFVTAPPDTISEYLLGPFPGPALIQVTGVGADPRDAFPPDELILLRLPPGGARALSEFLWNDIARDAAGRPKLVANGNYPGSLFYAAVTGYSLGHTCNNWAANALHAAGTALDSDGVMFSGQVMARALAAGGCASGTD